MIVIPNKHLERIESSSSKVLIREMCNIIEDLEKSNLNRHDVLELIKKLFKNKIYESSKYRSQLLREFTNGFKYSEINLR